MMTMTNEQEEEEDEKEEKKTNSKRQSSKDNLRSCQRKGKREKQMAGSLWP